DLVEPDWLELVAAEAQETLRGTTLEGSELVAVSAVTGQGVDDLGVRLERVLADAPPRDDRGRPRLPVDRVFTISGFGTVVTGTLVDGSLKVGEEVELQPSGRRARVRGLQQHSRKVEVALPGSRVAANLAGVEKEELTRGGVLADVDPRRHSRQDAAVRESLERRAAGEVLSEELRKYPRGITEQALLKATQASSADLSKLEARRAGQWLFAPQAWASLAARVGGALEEYHRLHPLRGGMPREGRTSRPGL